MKPRSILLLFAALLVLSAVKSPAQIVGITNGSSVIGTPGIAPWATTKSARPLLAKKHAPLNADFSYTHFNPSLPTIRIAVPFVVEQTLVGAVGERLELAGDDAAFLDSVQIGVDTSVGDGFTVYAYPDTLYQTPSGLFHLMNVYTEFGPYGVATVAFPQPGVSSRRILTAKFDGILIPKNFWILITPNTDPNGTFTSSFGLVADRGPVVTRTTSNTFSGFLYRGLSQDSVKPAVLDSAFYGADGQPIYSNFDITAYAESIPAEVASAGSQNGISVYPNPADRAVRFTQPASSYYIYDALGREVLAGRGESRVDLLDLAPGAYRILLQGSDGRSNSVLLVRR